MAPTLTSALIMTLTIWVKVTLAQDDDPRLAEELKCLSKAPAEICNVDVTFPQLLQALSCDFLVPESDEDYIQDTPALNVGGLQAEIDQALVLMFDPDAQVSNVTSVGILHWLAQVSIDGNGDVNNVKTLTEYHAPSPPRGDSPHRYQTFIFLLDNPDDLETVSGRRFELCPFLENSNLDNTLLYASQFRYQRP